MRPAGFDEALLADLPNLTRAAHAMTRRPQEVADLVHDTIAKALRFADTFDGTDLHRWLFTVMFNLYRDQRRKAWRAVEDPGDARALLVEIPPPQLPHMELREACAAIERLPAPFRDVMRLAATGMGQREIAAELGIGHATVRTRVWKARHIIAHGAYQ